LASEEDLDSEEDLEDLDSEDSGSAVDSIHTDSEECWGGDSGHGHLEELSTTLGSTRHRLLLGGIADCPILHISGTTQPHLPPHTTFPTIHSGTPTLWSLQSSELDCCGIGLVHTALEDSVDCGGEHSECFVSRSSLIPDSLQID